jgi:hypothetical protein
MSAATLTALAACARMARRTRDAGWILWTGALGVYAVSLLLRGWPGPITGDRATALRLVSSATAAIAAAGVARRLPGEISRATTLDMVPSVLAVSRRASPAPPLRCTWITRTSSATSSIPRHTPGCCCSPPILPSGGVAGR